MAYPRMAQLKTPAAFAEHIRRLGIELPFDPELQHGEDAPLAQPFALPGGRVIGNRFCVQPLEGWDASPDGRPSELTFRRWRRFGLSGARLVWGGEAAAVSQAARGNPNELLVSAQTLPDLIRLRETLLAAHAEQGSTGDLLIGLQLTDSGRYSRPEAGKGVQPRILYHHPLLDRKLGLPPDYPVLSDGEVRQVIDQHVAAAKLAQQAGFDFVDLKHCHGYLGHEFLSAVDRPGPYGGSFENRTRYLRELAAAVRSEAPGLEIGVRLSAFDFIPFQPGPDGRGQPLPWQGAYPYAFGGDGSGVGIDLSEPARFLALLEELGVRLVNLSAGNPYACPHIVRPALFPPSDGYAPPEDPLVGVARLVDATTRLKAQFLGLLIVGSGYSYLQEWLPHVAQRLVRTGQVDFIGLGRSMLAYPELSADVLAGRPLQRQRICRTFSDCTTAPRSGLVSGCYPLDPFYKQRPEAQVLKEIKAKR